MVLEKKRPVRMCFLCRKRDAKSNMLRYCFLDNSLHEDATQKAGGRGVYFHAECLRSMQGIKLKRLEHALRLKAGSLNYGGVVSVLDSVSLG